LLPNESFLHFSFLSFSDNTLAPSVNNRGNLELSTLFVQSHWIEVHCFKVAPFNKEENVLFSNIE